MSNADEARWLRLHQIIGQRAVSEEEARRNREAAKRARAEGKKPPPGPRRPRPGIQPLIPVSRSTWWDGCRGESPRFPRPEYPFGPHIALWRAEKILALTKGDRGSDAGR